MGQRGRQVAEGIDVVCGGQNSKNSVAHRSDRQKVQKDTVANNNFLYYDEAWVLLKPFHAKLPDGIVCLSFPFAFMWS